MKKIVQLSLPPNIAFVDDQLKASLKSTLGLHESDEILLKIKKRSIDARSRDIKVNLEAEIYINEEPSKNLEFDRNYPNITNAKKIIIVGAGPAGLFAALKAIELGFRPIVIERGKNVRDRRRDLAAINKHHIVNNESNYCFGEGGAGTYSDGKLYTRSKKRGDIRSILETFVWHGANDEILVDAHPHIGTNKLPKIVENLRESILKSGGEILFNTKVTAFVIERNTMKGVTTENNEVYEGEGVILATGHSARDIFEICKKQGIKIEAKPFALGVRVEHQQSLIDNVQYHGQNNNKLLPPSSYSLVSQSYYKGVQRGVFSFCMCPGGFIVPSATHQGELVVNGMSPSRRDSKFANSGIVVAVNEIDWQKYKHHDELAALEFQSVVEKKAFDAQLQSQKAPSQLIGDFIGKKTSTKSLETSYQPGLNPCNLYDILPDFIAHSLRDGLQTFGKKIKGFAGNEGQMIGIESRTSSPVRIPRIKETLVHPEIKGLYPCGEGAGYAGGIMSAAMDGERCAEALISTIL